VGLVQGRVMVVGMSPGLSQNSSSRKIAYGALSTCPRVAQLHPP
jgi:hypothetical protein